MEEFKEKFEVKSKEQKEQLEQAVIRFSEGIFRKSGHADIVDLFSATYTDPGAKISAYAIASGYLREGDIRDLEVFLELTGWVKDRFDKMRTTISSLNYALYKPDKESNDIMEEA